MGFSGFQEEGQLDFSRQSFKPTPAKNKDFGVKGAEPECSQVSGESMFSPCHLCFLLGNYLLHHCSLTNQSWGQVHVVADVCFQLPSSHLGVLPTQSPSCSPSSAPILKIRNLGSLGQEGLGEDRKGALSSTNKAARRPPWQCGWTH